MTPLAWSPPPGLIEAHLFLLVGALLVAALATRLVRRVALRVGFVARPRADRWARRVVPLGGGIGLYAALAPPLLLGAPDLFVGATIVFLLGLVDDRVNLRPKTKLLFQFLAAGWVVAAPLGAALGPVWARGAAELALPGPAALVIPVTVLWFVGVANSVNLLDNMDGSAAGVSGVAAAFLFVLAIGGTTPDPLVAALALSLLGATGGFLLHNFPPARIFMGDAGSLLLGFVLAGLAVRLPHAGAEAPLRDLAVMAFVLGAPLFDTGLVWVARRAARRPFLQGGRDHTTHRLMALGLSERRTVLVIYGVAAALGGIGLAVARGGLGLAVATAVGGGIALVLLGVFLGDVVVYRSADGQRLVPRSRHPALVYGIELTVDAAVLSAVWVGAWAIRFDEPALGYYLVASALPSLPLVVAIKIATLVAFRLYRGFWRTIRFRDVARIAAAVTLSSLLLVFVATLTIRFEDYSRAVIVIDWLLTLLAIVASRSALRFLRGGLGRLVDRPRRAVLFGPAALRPLLEPDLSEEHRLELAGVLDPELPPEVLLRQASEVGAEVAIVAAPLADDDPRLAALRQAGLELRPARLTLD